ncbi:MAG: hypothetical protein ACFE9N_08810 [Promethearchaeota archaeon]
MESKKNINSRRIVAIKIIGILIYSAIFFYLFYFLITLGFNPVIISILLLFIILATIGLFLRTRKRKLYSRMFPKKKYTEIEKVELRSKKDQNQEIKVPKAVNLELEYRKPLIDKCKYCGNIVPNFVKKCPFCNENIN